MPAAAGIKTLITLFKNNVAVEMSQCYPGNCAIYTKNLLRMRRRLITFGGLVMAESRAPCRRRSHALTLWRAARLPLGLPAFRLRPRP